MLADLALSIYYRQFSLHTCFLRFLAAALVTVQYSTATRAFDFSVAISEFVDQTEYSWESGFDLRPFPFWSNRRSLGGQLIFHSRFMSAHLWSCDDPAQERLRGQYVLRAGHDKPEACCAARSSDYQLVRRCRDRRKAQWHKGMRSLTIDVRRSDPIVGYPPPPQIAGVEAVKCPSEEAQAEFAMERRRRPDSEKAEIFVVQSHSKYEMRALTGSSQLSLGCESTNAEWKHDLAIYHKCIIVVILERLQLAPGETVLDWGSGCGHKLTWAAQLFGADGLGIDNVAESVAWAQDHSIGRYCKTDGRFLSWLPDNLFDVVISYAALLHLAPADQCDIVTELVGKVRIGGRLWFGWNDPSIYYNETEIQELEQDGRARAHDTWSRCFEAAARGAKSRWASGEVVVVWETVEEQFLFPEDMSAIGIYLYTPPAYSLFVTRLPARLDHHSGTGSPAFPSLKEI